MSSSLLRLFSICFRVLLHCYPASFRAEFGKEALQSFEDRCRTRRRRQGIPAMWLYALRSLGDAVAGGLSERVEDHLERPQGFLHRIQTQTGNFMTIFSADMKAAVRALLRRPGYALGVVFLLALGIGINGAVFNLANGILFKPLPYPEPGRLVGVWQTDRARGLDRMQLSKPDFEDFRSQNSTFQEMAATLGTIAREWSYQSLDGPVQLQGCYVTAGFFTALGTPPLLGRPFQPQEDSIEGGYVVVLSNRLWRSRFGSDPDIVGKSLLINDSSYQVVGVMPSEFAHPEWAELWAPMGPLMRPELILQVRGIHYLQVIGRLLPATSLEQAQADMDVVAAGLAQQYPATNKDRGAHLSSLREQLVGDARTPLYLLLGWVGFVLLIACANAAALLLVRVASRRREFGIRAALGAGRGRLIRQSLTESGLLALLGGGLGLLAAIAGTRLMVGLAANRLPRLAEVALDWQALAFVAGLSLLVALLAGLVPALSLKRRNPFLDLQGGGRGAAGGRNDSRLRGFLVSAQVALALALLAGSGLLLRSLVQLQQVDPGFRPASVLVAQMQLSHSRYPSRESIHRFMDRLRQEASRLPGVESAAVATSLPMIGVGMENIPYAIADELEALEKGEVAAHSMVTPGYFETMQIPLLKGRDFAANDLERADHPILVSRSLAEKLWPDQDPLGRRLALPDRRRAEVVGVVGDVLRRDLASEPRPFVYFPLGPHVRLSFKLVVRTATDPVLSAPGIQRVIQTVDPQLPVELAPMTQFVQDTLALPRLQLQLLGAFALLALLLSMVGLYGTLSYAVRQRRREMGIRCALGAARGDLLRLVLQQGMTLVVLGALLGLAGTLALSGWMATLLYEIQPGDPAALAASVLLVLLVSLLACTAPARQAARVDAVEVLREE